MESRCLVPTLMAMNEPPRDSDVPLHIDEANIDAVEKATREKVKQTIDVLDEALMAWQGMTAQPEHLRYKFMRYRQIRQVLADWERRAGEIPPGKKDFRLRARLLWEFVDICHVHSLR